MYNGEFMELRCLDASLLGGWDGVLDSNVIMLFYLRQRLNLIRSFFSQQLDYQILLRWLCTLISS